MGVTPSPVSDEYSRTEARVDSMITAEIFWKSPGIKTVKLANAKVTAVIEKKFSYYL